MTPTLFDLTPYNSPAADPPQRSERRSRSKPKKPNIIDDGFNLNPESQLAKKFRLGQLVKHARLEKYGVVHCKFMYRDRLCQIWIREYRERWGIEGMLMPYLPSALEIISPAPVPKLPRDVPPDDSVASSKAHSAVATESFIAVTESTAGGTARGDNIYFRLTWREGTRTRHRHIRGGNIYCSPARERAERVRDAIARGLPLEEILGMC